MVGNVLLADDLPENAAPLKGITPNALNRLAAKQFVKALFCILQKGSLFQIDARQIFTAPAVCRFLSQQPLCKHLIGLSIHQVTDGRGHLDNVLRRIDSGSYGLFHNIRYQTALGLRHLRQGRCDLAHGIRCLLQLSLIPAVLHPELRRERIQVKTMTGLLINQVEKRMRCPSHVGVSPFSRRKCHTAEIVATNNFSRTLKSPGGGAGIKPMAKHLSDGRFFA